MEFLDWVVCLASPLLSGLLAAAVVEGWERWRYR